MTRLVLELQLALFAVFTHLLIDTLNQRTVEAGQAAPEFVVTMDNGQTLRPDGFGGKLLVLNFWASWCQPCVSEMPSLDRFTQAMRDKGVVVAAISIDQNADAYRRFVGRLRPGFLTVRDGEARLSASFGTFAWPETYVIDASGRVVRKYIAERDWMAPEILEDIGALAGDSARR